MDTCRTNETAWYWCGLVLLVLGALDWIAYHLPVQNYHLGNRDRAFALLILGAIAFATSAVLREIGALRRDVALRGTQADSSPGTG